MIKNFCNFQICTFFILSFISISKSQNCIIYPDSVYFEVIPEYQLVFGGIYSADTFPASVWYGSRIALVVIEEVQPELRNQEVMAEMVRGLESIFAAYDEITGRTPPNFVPLKGRIRIEIDEWRPGYGGGGASHEYAGMITLKDVFEQIYGRLLRGERKYDHVFFYEIHRNYWFEDLDRSLIYYPKPPHHSVIIPFQSQWTAGVNNAIAYIAPSIMNRVDDFSVGSMTREEFGDHLESFYFTYVNNPDKYDWDNTWISEFIPWSNGVHSLDNLQAGTLIHLYKKFGLEFYKRLYRELANRPKVRNLANDYSRVRDNLYTACSRAVKQDLKSFFIDSLRWEISNVAMAEVTDYFSAPSDTFDVKSQYVYEPFDYRVSNKIQGLNGGKGWFGGWILEDQNGIIEIRNGSLAYDSLFTNGGHLYFSMSQDTPKMKLTRYLNKKYGCTGSSIWISYLLRPDKLAIGDVLLVPGNVQQFDVGKSWGPNFAIYTNQSSLPVSENKTHFITARLDLHEGDDIMYLWANPSLDEEPNINDAIVVQMDNNNGETIRLQLLIQGYGQGAYHLDEIRLGSTWEEVAPTEDVTTTSIENQTSIHELIFYPNPLSKGSNFLKLKHPLDFDGEFTIYTIDGKKIYWEKLSKGQENLNVSDLLQGIYLVTIINNDRNIIHSQKFVVL